MARTGAYLCDREHCLDRNVCNHEQGCREKDVVFAAIIRKARAQRPRLHPFLVVFNAFLISISLYSYGYEWP